MILDLLSRANRYNALSSGFAIALRFLRDSDLSVLPEGRIELRPGQVWATVVRKGGRPLTFNRWEYHRRHADIHYCVEGIEQCAWQPDLKGLEVASDYDLTADAGFAFGEVRDLLSLDGRCFSIIFPGEPHMPLLGKGVLNTAS